MILTMTLIISIAGAASPPALPGSVLAARQKISDKKRTEATQIIIEAIAKEKNDIQAKELKKELHRLATIFLTNEGQKIFELAESIRFSGQQGYMSKYEEALKTEDSNWQVLISQSIGFLRAKDCARAQSVLAAAEVIDPDREEAAVIKDYIQQCLEPKESNRVSSSERQVKSLELPKKILLAKKYILEENRERALAEARAAIALDEKYPTAYFLAWTALKGEENVGLDEAQNYLSLCKELTSAQRRKYFLDPELCLDTAGVERFIKQVESQAQ